MSVPRRKARKQIAPRLVGGLIRVTFGHGLPPAIKDGLRLIAARQRKSMSWVLEEIIIDYFDLPRPKYIKRKPVNQ